MAVISFIGLWLGYKTMCTLYQKASKFMLIPFFLVPTALIWSSGILKDTIIIGTIGLLLFTFSKMFIYRKKVLINASITIVGIFILQLFRPILLFVLIPTLFFWGVLYLTDSIKINFVKILSRGGIIIGIVGVGWLVNQNNVSETSKYKIDNLMKTLHGFQSFHSMEEFSEGQSVYNLGGIMSSPKEVIMNIPEALNVTFFRPYVWEINNIGMLLGGVESLFIFIAFVYVLIASRKTIIKILIQNKETVAMLIMAVTYAIIVGISSYNFGALSRYKIPSILFFLLSLTIIHTEEVRFNKSK